MKKTSLPVISAIITAIIASLCCIGPLFIAIIGVGGIGAFAIFESYRTYFILFTIVLLGLAFYFSYRKKIIVKMEVAKMKIRANGINLVFGLQLFFLSVLSHFHILILTHLHRNIL